MRYGFWVPMFRGWLRNIDDERMSATWDYVRDLTTIQPGRKIGQTRRLSD
jgi:FMNH2-dependent dimethyl sulfone monooxygenase